MTPQQRQAVIAALLKKDMAAIREQKGEIFIIRNFFDHLKFSQTEGRTEQDFSKIIFAPGEYRTALEKLNTNSEGELSPMPFWMVPPDSLNDAEIEAYKEGEDKL